jgi:hypothetical protein
MNPARAESCGEQTSWARKALIRNGHDPNSLAEGERHLSRTLVAEPEILETRSRLLSVRRFCSARVNRRTCDAKQLASVQIQKTGTAARVGALRKHLRLPGEMKITNSPSLAPIRREATLPRGKLCGYFSRRPIIGNFPKWQAALTPPAQLLLRFFCPSQRY